MLGPQGVSDKAFDLSMNRQHNLTRFEDRPTVQIRLATSQEEREQSQAVPSGKACLVGLKPAARCKRSSMSSKDSNRIVVDLERRSCGC